MDNETTTTAAEVTATAETTTTTTETKLSQKDAVFTFVKETLEEAGTFGQAEGLKLKELVTKEVRKAVRTRLFEAIKAGEIKLAKQYDNSKLKKYCSGLINNWLKKDPRFN